MKRISLFKEYFVFFRMYSSRLEGVKAMSLPPGSLIRMPLSSTCTRLREGLGLTLFTSADNQYSPHSDPLTSRRWKKGREDGIYRDSVRVKPDGSMECSKSSESSFSEILRTSVASGRPILISGEMYTPRRYVYKLALPLGDMVFRFLLEGKFESPNTIFHTWMCGGGNIYAGQLI